MATPAPLTAPTKPTLYHTQYFSSSRAAAILIELGLVGTPDSPIEIVEITVAQLKSDPVLTQLNPQRRLPFFRDPAADLNLTESGGLAQYLLETYDTAHKLHPEVGDKTRADFLQLMHFGPATCYHIAVPIMFKRPPAGLEAFETKDDVFEQKKKEWHDFIVPTLEQALDKFGGPYLLGPKMTAADLVVGYDVMTAAFAGAPALLDDHPKIKAYSETISKLDSYAKLYTPSE